MTTETDEKQKTKDASKKAEEWAEKLRGMAKPVLDGIVFLIPFLIKYGRLARVYIEKLPTNAFNFLVGFIFCFFGGFYPVLFAAIQRPRKLSRTSMINGSPSFWVGYASPSACRLLGISSQFDRRSHRLSSVD